MAIVNLNSVFKEIRGTLGKQVVIKQYKNKTVITAYPEHIKKEPTKLQEIYRDDFTKAIKYAQDILRNPIKKKAYEKKVKEGQSVYHFAIAEYKKKYGIKKGD